MSTVWSSLQPSAGTQGAVFKSGFALQALRADPSPHGWSKCYQYSSSLNDLTGRRQILCAQLYGRFFSFAINLKTAS